jgi:drug/metabolite transporter (DMT)-like permease
MRSPLWFVVAGLIALAGFAGALFYLMPRLAVADAQMMRVVVPGSAVLTLDKPGSYTIYHEKKSTDRKSVV